MKTKIGNQKFFRNILGHHVYFSSLQLPFIVLLLHVYLFNMLSCFIVSVQPRHILIFLLVYVSLLIHLCFCWCIGKYCQLLEATVGLCQQLLQAIYCWFMNILLVYYISCQLLQALYYWCMDILLVIIYTACYYRLYTVGACTYYQLLQAIYCWCMNVLLVIINVLLVNAGYILLVE